MFSSHRTQVAQLPYQQRTPMECKARTSIVNILDVFCDPPESSLVLRHWCDSQSCDQQAFFNHWILRFELLIITILPAHTLHHTHASFAAINSQETTLPGISLPHALAHPAKSKTLDQPTLTLGTKSSVGFSHYGMTHTSTVYLSVH